METCLCRQTLKIKDLQQMCLDFLVNRLKSNLVHGTRNAQKDIYVVQPCTWNQALEKMVVGAWKSVVFNTVQHKYG